MWTAKIVTLTLATLSDRSQEKASQARKARKATESARGLAVTNARQLVVTTNKHAYASLRKLRAPQPQRTKKCIRSQGFRGGTAKLRNQISPRPIRGEELTRHLTSMLKRRARPGQIGGDNGAKMRKRTKTRINLLKGLKHRRAVGGTFRTNRESSSNPSRMSAAPVQVLTPTMALLLDYSACCDSPRHDRQSGDIHALK